MCVFAGVSVCVTASVCVWVLLLLLLVAYPVTGIIVWPPWAELHFSCRRAFLFLLCDFPISFFKSNAACSWLLSALEKSEVMPLCSTGNTLLGYVNSLLLSAELHSLKDLFAAQFWNIDLVLPFWLMILLGLNEIIIIFTQLFISSKIESFFWINDMAQKKCFEIPFFALISLSVLCVLDECWPRIATGIDSSWFAAPASPSQAPPHTHVHVHRNGYGFEARPAVEPYGVLILTAADKLLNAGPFCSLSALCGLMLVGVSACIHYTYALPLYATDCVCVCECGCI